MKPPTPTPWLSIWGPRLAPILVLVIVLAIPLFLISSNVRWAFNSFRLYQYALERYDAPTRTCVTTCISAEELQRAAREIIRYFNSKQELLDITVQTDAGVEPLFTEKEVLHMKDVKGLVRGFYSIQLFAAIAIAGAVALGLMLRRGGFLRPLYRGIVIGSGFTGAFVLLVALGVLINFDWTFERFHLASFSNLLWELEPTDRLLLMFPQGFWFDAALFLGGAILLEAALLSLATWWIARWVQKRHQALVVEP